MAANKSETIKQREKAQRDLIELRRMQAGELPLPEKEEAIPLTKSQKVANFFYHNKIALIIGGILAIIGIIVISDLVTRVKYDSKIVLFSYETAYSTYSRAVGDYFETLYGEVEGDITKNGKVELAVLDCSANNSNINLKNERLTQLHSIMATEKDTLIYIVDRESLKHFDGLSNKFFKEENIVPLGDDFYEFIKAEGVELPDTPLYAALRVVEGTTLEGKDQTAFEKAEAVIDLLKQKAATK